MSSIVHPSLMLKMDFDTRVCTADLEPSIMRAYSYIGPTEVCFHDSDASDIENILRISVKLHKPYWDKMEEGAQENWDPSMKKWLTNIFSKVSNTITASNAIRCEEGREQVHYAWIELFFNCGVKIRMAAAPDSSIPADAVFLVDKLRNCMAERWRPPPRSMYSATRRTTSMTLSCSSNCSPSCE